MEEDRTTLEIIEKCLQDVFDIDFLQSKASKLNVDRFCEIAEELAVNKRCGYLLCKSSLTAAEHAKSQQKFKIRYNRIFNVSQRRLFCSDECFALFCEAKDQFEESPNPNKSIVFHFPQQENHHQHHRHLENRANSQNGADGHVTDHRVDCKPGLVHLGEEVHLRYTADIADALKDLSILDKKDSEQQEKAPPGEKNGNFRSAPDLSRLSAEDVERSRDKESRDRRPVDEALRDPLHSEDVMDTSASKEIVCRKKHTDPEEALNEIRQKYFEKSDKKGLKWKKSAPKLIDPLPLNPVSRVDQ